MLPLSRRGASNTYCNTLAGQIIPNRNQRYFKLNFTSYEKYGILEFRHHSGTIEADKIINWILLTQIMVNHAKASYYKVKDISRPLPWGILKVTLGLSRKIKLNIEWAKDLASFYDNRIQALAA